MCQIAISMIAHSIILGAIASFALLSDSATALAMPDSALTLQARTTSGINVEAACNIYYGTSFSAVAAGSGCNDWVCVRGSERYGLDFNQWCRDSWGGNSYATCGGGVYNWVCNY